MWCHEAKVLHNNFISYRDKYNCRFRSLLAFPRRDPLSEIFFPEAIYSGGSFLCKRFGINQDINNKPAVDSYNWCRALSAAFVQQKLLIARLSSSLCFSQWVETSCRGRDCAI